MNRKKTENIFFLMEKRKLFEKKKNKCFLEEQTLIIYRYFFVEEREGVYFKLKYLLSYLQFFF